MLGIEIMSGIEMSDALKQTVLTNLHKELGAKMVPFAGYEMPVQYPMGVMKEHLHCRAQAGLFDVSHMGQCFLIPEDGKYETVAKAIEKIVPADILGLAPGQQRYTQFLNKDGGILDDLMVSRLGMDGHQHWAYLVVNAACKEQDFAHLSAHMPDGINIKILDDMSLLALQGPKAAEIISQYIPKAATMPFMSSMDMPFMDDIWVHISRSGYTGEDGYELAIKNKDAVCVAEALLSHDQVAPIGLGARDSLRLEAGLCLYGHDIDKTTSPVEAGLLWSIPKHRREQGGFLGAERVQKELAEKPSRRRIGIMPDGRAPARQGTQIQSEDGKDIGVITSGGFGPSVGGPVAMGYVKRKYAKIGTKINLLVRGKTMPAHVVKLPFIANNFYRGE